MLLGGQVLHLLLDLWKVGIGNYNITSIHIIVEAVIYGWSDPEFCSWIKGFNGFCHQVSRGMPEGMLGFFFVPFMQLNGCVFLNGATQVPDLLIYSNSKDLFSQAVAQGFSYTKAADARFKFLYRPIRKSYIDH